MLLERVLERYAAPKNQRHRILFHYDQHVLARATLAHVLCLQGYVDQAKEQARISFEEAGTSDDGFSRCWALQPLPFRCIFSCAGNYAMHRKMYARKAGQSGWYRFCSSGCDKAAFSALIQHLICNSKVSSRQTFYKSAACRRALPVILLDGALCT